MSQKITACDFFMFHNVNDNPAGLLSGEDDVGSPFQFQASCMLNLFVRVLQSTRRCLQII
jgi:hypothetical protein